CEPSGHAGDPGAGAHPAPGAGPARPGGAPRPSRRGPRAAGHEDCGTGEPPGSPPCVRVRAQAASAEGRGGGHPTGNRPAAGAGSRSERTRDKRAVATKERPTASDRRAHLGRDAQGDEATGSGGGSAGRLDDAHLSIEERYDEVRQLISLGKEKGYLLYDEVNELLPSEITSSDELDDLFNTFGSAGIEVIDSDQ